MSALRELLDAQGPQIRQKVEKIVSRHGKDRATALNEICHVLHLPTAVYKMEEKGRRFGSTVFVYSFVGEILASAMSNWAQSKTAARRNAAAVLLLGLGLIKRF